MSSPREAQTSPVFFDATERRWKWVRGAALLVGLGVGSLAAALTLGLLEHPKLPPLRLPHFSHFMHPHPVLGVAQQTASSSTQSDPTEALERTAVSSSSSAAPNTRSEAIGFFVNWDDNSFSSLKAHLSSLNKLMPEWLHLEPNGNVQVDDPLKQARALDFVRANKPSLKVMALINNYDGKLGDWNPKMLEAVLSSEASRTRLIDNLLEFVRDPNRDGKPGDALQGVNIDFETVPTSSQRDLERFMAQLYARFHPLGLEVSESVPLDDAEFNYKTLAMSADYLVLMGYDEHETSSVAGPVASQGWLGTNLAERLAQLPPNKVVLALGNYGYDWTVGKTGADEVAFQDAQTTAKESEGVIGLDKTSLNPHFDYFDDANVLHHVWYLDAASLFNELRSSQTLKLRGVALWRLGQEDPSSWKVLDARNHLNADVAKSLEKVHYGYDLDYRGQGEILKVTSTPRDGSRLLGLEAKSGLIVSEKLAQYASPYVLTRWGATKDKRIALTFDDGPDPAYTPAILDILKKSHVPATFFLVGANAELNPDLVRRTVGEGHELGSHSFTHPNLSVVSPAQFDLELSSTQRLLESLTGRSTLLFRPPFAEDVEPATPEQAGPVARAGELGYYTVGMGVDPLDWQPGQTAQHIVSSILSQLHNHEGQIILLHDAGGVRSATVQALPTLLELLKKEGYSFVTVSNLMGVTRNAVMPKVGGLLRGVDGAGFGLLEWLSYALRWLFVVGIALSIGRLAFIAVLALLERWNQKRTLSKLESGMSRYSPRVAVIVPAYNEEKVVLKTVQSLLEQDYLNLEIIVVDDGSSDRTYEVARAEFGEHPRVRIFCIPNGGKSGALNFGMAQTEADIVVLLDADTVLSRSAVRLLAAHFADPRVGATAGNAKVGNRLNLMTRWQALEYITAQNLERRAFALLNCITVVPGAIGAWRRAAVLELGGFASDTLAEDADLTLRLLRAGWKITYEMGAIAYTEAPDTVKGFLKQRFRWMFGTLQATFKHRDTLFRSRYGALGLVTLPNVFLFQIAFPFVSALLDVYMVFSLLWASLQSFYHPLSAASSEPNRALVYYALFLVVDLAAAALAFLLERREDWRLLPWLPLQRFFYRQLLYVVAIQAALSALRGTRVGWGVLERKATVRVEGGD